jgi:transposase-like protein
MPTPTTFPEKKRLAAVRRVESGKATIAEQAKKTGCSPSTLRGWVRRYGSAVEEPAPKPKPKGDPPAPPKRDVVFDLHAHGARVLTSSAPAMLAVS